LSRLGQSHHYLTPPSLLLPLEHNNISELTVSFVAGQWDQRRSGEAGPLHYESGGGGGEVRGWLRSNGDKAECVAKPLGGGKELRADLTQVGPRLDGSDACARRAVLRWSGSKR
jgi:hypothetical protein